MPRTALQRPDAAPSYASGPSFRPRSAALLLGAVTAVALAVRLAALGSASLWFDELLEYERATAPWREVLLGRHIDQDPPLFAMLHSAWLHVAPSHSEAWLRLPTAVAGSLAVWMLGRWAGGLFGHRTGLLAALFMALAPVHVHYSRELNQYAWMTLLMLVCLVTWERVRRGGSTADWSMHALASAAALLTHYGMAFPLAIMTVDLLAITARRGQAGHRQQRAMAAYAGLLLFIGAALLAGGLGERLDTGHVQKRFGGTHLQKELDYFLDAAWRQILVFFHFPFAGGSALAFTRAFSGLELAGALSLSAKHRAGTRVFAGMLGGTVALSYLASLFGLYPIGYRYGLYAAPIMLVPLAGGCLLLGRLPLGRYLTALSAAAVCAAFVAFAPHASWDNPHLTVPREEARPVIAQLAQRFRDGEALYVYHAALPAFRYYALGPRLGAATAQCFREAPLVEGDAFESLSADAVAREAGRILDAATTSPGRAVWLFWTHVHAANLAAIETALAALPLRETDRISATNAFAVRLAPTGALAGPAADSFPRPHRPRP